MTNSRKLISAALVGLMTTAAAAPVLTTPALAEASATDQKTQTGMLRTAAEAAATLAQVHAARVAIFDDNIDQAKKLTASAETTFAKAESDLMVADPEAGDGKAAFLPMEATLALSESFQPTDENKTALEKAGGLIQNAKTDEAIEVLRVASIDVSVQAALLPADTTLTHIQEASKLLEDGKYHEANVALKAIENSVIVRSFDIDAIPAQGKI